MPANKSKSKPRIVTNKKASGGRCASACSILEDAAVTLDERANQRDTLEERSMRRCVDAFNGLTDHELTEEDGWLFMAVLKMARARNGRSFHRDDYLDGAAYIALAGECASKSND